MDTEVISAIAGDDGDYVRFGSDKLQTTGREANSRGGRTFTMSYLAEEI